jgi:choline dehydrogenase
VGDDDLQAMVEGVKYVRRLAASMRDSGACEEQIPGASCDSDEAIAEWIRTNAWGHHASCTAAIGDPGAGGVVSGDFRVHGVRNLRIVDASVFPRIPGFFIASSIYTIGEKAADVILSDRS